MSSNVKMDTHVTIMPYFTVPEGKMEEFKAGFPQFYKNTRAGTKECLYYGFTTSGNKAFCREGYQSADGVLAHLADCKAPLDAAVALVGEGGLDLAVMGPKAELDKLREPLGPLGAKFYELDELSVWFGGASSPQGNPDAHCGFIVYFTLPQELRAKAVEIRNKMIESVKSGTDGTLYYGFADTEDGFIFREGYSSGAAVAAHAADISEHSEAMKEMYAAGASSTFHAFGPRGFLDHLDETMTKFELDSGCAWFGEQHRQPDTHVTLVPYFTVPDGKMDEFIANFTPFYTKTWAGTEECLYYGFTVNGNTVYCREGYRSAEGVLAHLVDCDEPLKAAVALVGEGGLDLAVMGPKSELDKLREPLGPLGTKFFDLDSSSTWWGGASPGPDSHVTLCPYFTVPEEKKDAFKAGFQSFYQNTLAGTKDTLYYGFAECGDKIFCREGYKSAEGVLAHLADCKEPLDAAVAMVGEGGLDLAVMGPKEELDKLREPLGPLGTKFYDLDLSSSWFGARRPCPDTHVTLCPYFTVPDGKLEAFQANFKPFYEATRAGTKECLYYGFAISGNTVYCREAYKSAAGVLAHLDDCKAPLDAAVAMVGEGGLNLAVMGPKAELDKLREPLGPLGTAFYELDQPSMWWGGIMEGPDIAVTLHPYFTVPEGKMADFKANFSGFYENTKAGTKEVLYYGFAEAGNKVFCREAYRSAEGVLAHLADCKAPLDAAVAMVGEGGLDLAVMGPKAELDKLREPLGPLGTKFYELDTESFWKANI